MLNGDKITNHSRRNSVQIMGILNTSPESFYKKSIKITKDAIKRTVINMERNGANFIDVGGMSTAPYLETSVPIEQEVKRVTKAINIIQNVSNIPISVDTPNSLVAKNVLDMGVRMVNDVTGLKHDKKMADLIAKYDSSIVICAYGGTSPIPSNNPLSQTSKLLKESIRIAKKSNIDSKKIIIDPSIGFFRKTGKSKFYTKINGDWAYRDLYILQNLGLIKEYCNGLYPLLVSVSNKSFIGKLIGKKDSSDRISASLAFEAMSVLRGADIIRTHNVKETKTVLRMIEDQINR